MSNPAIKTSVNNDVAIYPLKPHGHPLLGVASPSREEIRAKLLTDKIRHISMADIDALPTINAMSHMAFQARNLARASQIFEAMLNGNEDQVKNWSEILYNQALLTEGNSIPNPVRFSKLIADLMIQSNKTQ
jgi:HSP90 family molecular chaperone